MLTSLLDKIPGAFSRRFLLCNFLPLLLFVLASAAAAVTCLAAAQDFADWFDRRPALVQAALGTGAALVLAAAAMATAGLNTLGRLVLELAVAPPSLAAALAARHHAELRKAQDACEAARLRRRECKRLADDAVTRLRDARIVGTAIDPPHAAYPPGDRLPADIEGISDPAALRKAVDTMARVLRTNNVNTPNGDAAQIDADHGRLLDALERRVEALTADFGRKSKMLDRDFPGGRLYPTRYARIAGILRNYAEYRYGADYAVLWPRLEAVMRKEEPQLYEAVQEAAIQLDFHVAMFWMTALFAAIWTTVLLAAGFDVRIFWLVALAAPALCCVWYVLGGRSYGALADQACTAVDLVRLKVFDAIGLVQPKSYEEERRFWAELGSTLEFGGNHAIAFRNAPPSAAKEPDELRVRLRLDPMPRLPMPRRR